MTRGSPRKFDHQAAKVLYEGGRTIEQVARAMNVATSSMQKALVRAGTVMRSRDIWDRSNDEELTALYVVQGWGARRCSRYFNVPEHVVHHATLRLGISDSTRWPTKLHASAGARQLKRKPHEFPAHTKQQAFNLAGGRCSICGLVISYWGFATYHHIKPIDSGGSCELSNCQVLCPSQQNHPDPLQRGCHIVHFVQLHGGRRWRFHLAKEPAYPAQHKCPRCARLFHHPGLCGTCIKVKVVPQCVWCGRARKLTPLHLCTECSRPRRSIKKKPLGVTRPLQVCPKCGNVTRILHPRGCQRCLLPWVLEQRVTRTIRDIAEELGVSNPTIIHWCASQVKSSGHDQGRRPIPLTNP